MNLPSQGSNGNGNTSGPGSAEWTETEEMKMATKCKKGANDGAGSPSNRI